MSTQTPKRGDSRRDEVIAGEYVLGALSPDDRRKVEARMVLDSNFAAMVNRWQINLSSLDAVYEPAQPALKISTEKQSRILEEPTPRPAGSLWSSLTFWRILTGLAIAGLAAVAFIEGGRNSMPAGSVPIVAELGGEGDALALIARYDAGTGKLLFAPVASTLSEARSLQVWMIEGTSAPVSLGVLPQTGEGALAISPDLAAGMKDGMTLAISVEPAEGSEASLRSGPIVASGTVRRP